MRGLQHLRTLGSLFNRNLRENTLLDGVRGISNSTDLKSVLAEKIPQQQERLKAIKKAYGSKQMGQVSVDMVIGGMRGITGVLWETSLLDPDEGIRFRGYSIPELQEKLPSAIPDGEPLPEGLMWLLLTGELPNKEQVAALSADLRSRAKLPDHVNATLKAMHPDTHPMTQFSAGVLALQPESNFAAAYEKGINKMQYWDPVYEDTMNLIAKLPALAATIYRNVYKGGELIEADPNLDWAANLAHMMGFEDQGAQELMRLYQTIHTDHEGGNGPCMVWPTRRFLSWLFRVREELGDNPSKDQVKDFVWATLKSGRVVPGYGHAVLRKTDPRYACQRVFAMKHLPDYPMFRLVSLFYEVVPSILQETGKVKNPWPNVDAHSGVLLQYYGIKEQNFYTVLFGVSRAIGVLSQAVWSRALGLPIERPKSVTMEVIEKKFSGT
ncbi:hypothetical protein WJX84_011472 [Apatococcus fuscideae]|uniref:Citrate synthase n=1 Tax=Apatococcus fuscideae TaxID=2026836 RepID=A0AAW1SUU6_9CHLO